MLVAARKAVAASAAGSAAGAVVDALGHPRVTLRGIRLEPRLSLSEHARLGLERAATRAVAAGVVDASVCLGAASARALGLAAPLCPSGRIAALGDVDALRIARSLLRSAAAKATADLARAFGQTDLCYCSRRAASLSARDLVRGQASPELRECVRAIWEDLSGLELRRGLGLMTGLEYAADLAGHALTSTVREIAYELTRGASARSRAADASRARPGFLDAFVAGVVSEAIGTAVEEALDRFLAAPAKAWLRGEGWSLPSPRLGGRGAPATPAPAVRRLLSAGMQRALWEYFQAVLSNL